MVLFVPACRDGGQGAPRLKLDFNAQPASNVQCTRPGAARPPLAAAAPAAQPGIISDAALPHATAQHAKGGGGLSA